MIAKEEKVKTEIGGYNVDTPDSPRLSGLKGCKGTSYRNIPVTCEGVLTFWKG